MIGGGCSGLQYKMDLVDGPRDRDILIPSNEVNVAGTLNLLVAALNFGSFAFIIAHLHQTLSPHADRDALLDVISRESGEGRG